MFNEELYFELLRDKKENYKVINNELVNIDPSNVLKFKFIYSIELKSIDQNEDFVLVDRIIHEDFLIFFTKDGIRYLLILKRDFFYSLDDIHNSYLFTAYHAVETGYGGFNILGEPVNGNEYGKVKEVAIEFIDIISNHPSYRLKHLLEKRQ